MQVVGRSAPWAALEDRTATVANSVTNYDVAGTAGAVAVGDLAWTNNLTGDSGAEPVATSAPGLPGTWSM